MWITFAIISALAITSRTIYTKKILNEKIGPFFTIWITVFIGMILSGLITIIVGFSTPTADFWPILFIRVMLDCIALVSFTYAIKQKEVSLVVPMLTFSPVLTSITSFLMVGQLPSNLGVIGICIIVFGGLMVILSEVNYRNFSANIPLLKTTALVLVTLICWSFLAPLHKLGIDNSSSITYLFFGNIAFSLVFFLPAVLIDKSDFKRFLKLKVSPAVYLLGLFLIIEFGSQLIAIQSGLVGYVSAIKSSNIVITTIAAIVLLKERPGKLKLFIRLLGTFAAAVGVALIVLAR